MTPSDLIVSILQFALNSVLASLTLDPSRDIDELKIEREAAAAMLASLNPRDAIQAAFAVRAVTAHHAAMECFRRAALPDVPNAMMTRLMSSGMALSRMSVQMIKALEQRKALARPAASAVDPIETILAANAPTVPVRTPERNPAARSAPATQHPMSIAKPAAAGASAAAGVGAGRPASPVPAAAGLPEFTRDEITAMAALSALRTSAA